MADPVSAEPKNWEDDILLKVSMPGKSLREVTKIKMRQAETRVSTIQQNQQQNLQKPQVPIMGTPRYYQNTNQEPTQQEQPTQQVQPNTEPVINNQQIQEPQEIAEQHQVQETSVQESNQETQSQEISQVNEVSSATEDIQEKQEVLTNMSEEPISSNEDIVQNYVEESTEELVSEMPEPRPIEPIYQEPIIETKPGSTINFRVDNYEKIKIMTIEPEKEVTVKNMPSHMLNPIEIQKAESFANRLIGSDISFRKKK